MMPLPPARFIAHRSSVEPSSIQHLPAFLAFAVQIFRRTFGQAEVQIRVSFNCVVSYLRTRVLFWSGPNSKTKLASRFQNAARFGACSFWIRDVQQSEVHKHAIETAVFEREVLCVALLELNLRKHSLRYRDHVVGEIYSGGNRAGLFRCGRHV